MKRVGLIISGVCLAALGACGSSSGGGDAQEGVDAAPEVSGPPTWYRDIQPLVHGSCASCHYEGGIGPFALTDYDDVKALGVPVLQAIEDNTMPPWLAQESEGCEPPHDWKDDIRLSDEQKQLVADWVEADYPLGDEATATPLPEAPSLELANPDVTMQFEQPFAVSGEDDLFECFVLDPGNSEKVWITGVQMSADNAKVDHHALVFLDINGESPALATDGHFPCFNNPDVEGSLVGAWAPGAVPFEMPEGAGIPMPAGARIVVQMHYHPTGNSVEMDQSSVQLEYVTEQPANDAALALIGNFGSLDGDGQGLQPGPNDTNGPEFRIPAGAQGHTETLVYRHEIPLSVPVFGVGAHMHYVGTGMKIEHRRAGGDEQCLLETPNWDFDWQRSYTYDAPVAELPQVGPGDEFVMTCTYDNSMNNPAVVDALTEQGLTQPGDVFLGEETLDEMCLGIFGILLPPGIL